MSQSVIRDTDYTVHDRSISVKDLESHGISTEDAISRIKIVLDFCASKKMLTPKGNQIRKSVNKDTVVPDDAITYDGNDHNFVFSGIGYKIIYNLSGSQLKRSIASLYKDWSKKIKVRHYTEEDRKLMKETCRDVKACVKKQVPIVARKYGVSPKAFMIDEDLFNEKTNSEMFGNDGDNIDSDGIDWGVVEYDIRKAFVNGDPKNAKTATANGNKALHELKTEIEKVVKSKSKHIKVLQATHYQDKNRINIMLHYVPTGEKGYI